MVKMIAKSNQRLPLKLRRVSGYAARIVNTMLPTVPTAVMTMLFQNALKKFVPASSSLNDLPLNPTGQSDT
ncbi:hypothetical protein D3C84_1282610 [compost metagenome]